MIIGKNVILRLYNSQEEVKIVNDIFNNLSERSILDHTEIYSNISLAQEFNNSGFWGKDHGTLLITKNKDKILGTISFGRKSEFELSIGYRILKNENRNQGYMTESLQLFSSYLFNTIPLITRLSIYTAENNKSSRKLAEKCMFKLEGILRDAYFYRGEICNWAVYSLLRDECTF